MKKLMIALVLTFVLTPLASYAQERVNIDVSYTLGDFKSAFDYPKEETLATGKQYNTNGFAIEAKVRVTNIVSAGYRHEHAGLGNAELYQRGGRFNMNSVTPDFGHNSGEVSYSELHGSFTLPTKSRGHSLIVGIARSAFDRVYDKINLDVTHTGLVLGGEGRQTLAKITFDYASRYYLRMNRTDLTVGDGFSQSRENHSSAFELRGTAMWTIAKHVGLTGGVQWRRFRTEGPDNDPWVIHENQPDLKFKVGTRLSF